MELVHLGRWVHGAYWPACWVTAGELIIELGTTRTTVIYAGDRWRPEEQWDSRYVWMPLEIGGGKLWLPEPRPWRIDIVSGEVSFPVQ